MSLRFVPAELAERFQVVESRNGLAVLAAANPDEWADIVAVLGAFRLLRSEIQTPGGSKSLIAERLDRGFRERDWQPKRFETQIKIDDRVFDSPTHEVDVFKGRVAIEVEWNNKDPFFDRDLNNFRLLFDLRVIDVGVIITRATGLEKLFAELGREKQSYGAATTHLDRLRPRLDGGGGGGCPVVAFAITRACYVDNGEAEDA